MLTLNNRIADESSFQAYQLVSLRRWYIFNKSVEMKVTLYFDVVKRNYQLELKKIVHSRIEIGWSKNACHLSPGDYKGGGSHRIYYRNDKGFIYLSDF